MATIYQNAAEISVCTQNIDQAILEHGIEMDGGGLGVQAEEYEAFQSVQH